jgi:DnaJ-class molecular chaperone
MQKNYYLLLGVNNNASTSEIKTAYRGLAKKYHPDTNYGNKAAEDYFKEIQEAYSILANQGKRKMYDLSFSFGSNYYQKANYQKTKAYTQYTGNAYQYAQQEAYHHQQNKQKPFTEKEYKQEKPDKTERYQLLICVAIALVLLYFIVS